MCGKKMKFNSYNSTFPVGIQRKESLCFCNFQMFDKHKNNHQSPSWRQHKFFLALLFLYICCCHINPVYSDSLLLKRNKRQSWNSPDKKKLFPAYGKYIDDDPDDNDGDDEDDNQYNTEKSFSPKLDLQHQHYQICFKGGEYLTGYTLEGGVKAGNFINLGEVESLKDCASLCCQKRTCMRAITLVSPTTALQNCFQVDCHDKNSLACKPSSATRSSYKPSLFLRGVFPDKTQKEATSEQTKHSIITNDTILDKDLPSLQRYKRGRAFCQTLDSNNVCSDLVDATKLYYFTSKNTSELNKRLEHPISLLSKRLDGRCRTIALQAICYRFYPQCSDQSGRGSMPTPIRVCEDECNTIMSGDCADSFEESGMSKYLQRVVPNCVSIKNTVEEIEENDDEMEECIKLKYKLPTLEHVQNTSTIPSSAPLLKEHEGQKSSLTIVDIKNTTDDAETNFAENEKSGNTKKKESINKSSTPTTLTTAQAAVTSTPTTQMIPSSITTAPVAKHPATSVPLLAVTKVSTLSTHTESLEVKTDTSKKADIIRVSAGENAVLKPPDDKISLYSSTWPKEPTDGDYSYLWTQTSAPPNSHGDIEGKATKSVKLTNLKLPGVYTFKLEVTSKSGKHGVGYVNITVKQDHKNRPPRAEIFPTTQEITLPTNTIILDGSKSSDDDKIVSYKWEELKNPIKQKTEFTSTDKKILELKNLVAGAYKFKLTVTDSEGEKDSTEATVLVKKEQDYPPEANAGNDVIINLPDNNVILNGNKSKDDKGVLTYAWRKTAESPTCDIIGTDKPILQVSRMVVGTYVFVLKVTDSSGQSNEAQVKVVVLAEQNTVPVAVAGDDKELVYPDASTTLDGSRSTDNSKIVKYLWEKASGPDKIKMVDANSAKVHVTDLVTGTYVFKLTVTDDKKLTGIDTVKVHVKKNHNDPPIAVAGKDHVIYLPMRTTSIDGSASHDDEFIESYSWVRAGLSPAAGKVVNGSDKQAILQLTGLVKGQYTFELTVTDNKGRIGTDTAVLNVKESKNSLSLVEMYLKVDINKFTQEDKKQLVRKISVILEVPQEHVVVQEIADVGYRKGIKIVFLVNDPDFQERKYDGKFVADTLKQKVGNGGKLFDLTMVRVQPYVCRNNCSGHGYCDESSKECTCDAFWTANVFKSNFGEHVSNCDWSVLYISVVIFGILVAFLGICWTVCFCLARKKRNRRRTRYRALRSTDPDGAEDEILMIPKGLKSKFTANSLTFTESDEDSDDETTVFDKKQRRRNGSIRMNGHANGKLPQYLDDAF